MARIYWQMFHIVVLCVTFLFGRHVCALKLPETSEEFIEALKDKDDDELLTLLGRHAVEEHKECDNVKHKFADYVHKSGRYLLRSRFTQQMHENLLVAGPEIPADSRHMAQNVSHNWDSVPSSFPYQTVVLIFRVALGFLTCKEPDI